MRERWSARWAIVAAIVLTVALFGLPAPTASPIADVLWRAGLVGALAVVVGTDSMRQIALLGVGALALALLDGLVALPVWLLVVGVAIWVRRPSRRVVGAGVALLAVAAAVGAAGMSAGRDAADELTLAREDLRGLEVGDLDDLDDLDASLSRIEVRIDRARSRLDSAAATAARYLPVVGTHLAVARIVVDGTDEVVEAAKPLQSIDVTEFGVDGGLESGRVLAASKDVAAVASAAAEAEASLAEVERGWLMPWLTDDVDEAESVLGDGATEADRLARLLQGVWRQTGGERAVRWFVLLCSPVEARASCGFPGNFVELVFADGRLEIVDRGRVTDLEQRARDAGLELAVGGDYEERYGEFGVAQTIRNVTLSPHWPDVADALRQLYGDLTSRSVDVVVGMNTAGLAALLHVTGPVEMGELGTVTPQNARRRLEIDQYARLGLDPARVDSLAELTDAIVDRLVAGPTVSSEAIRAFSAASDQGGVLLHALDDPERLARDGGVAGELPDIPIGVTWQNAAGNKLDAYADTTISYRSPGATTPGCIVFTLTNDPPDELPAIAAGYGGVVPPYWQRSLISVYSPTPVASLTVSGDPATFSSEREHAAWVAWRYVDLAPGETVTIVAELAAGASEPATLRLQPSARPPQVSVATTDACSR